MRGGPILRKWFLTGSMQLEGLYCDPRMFVAYTSSKITFAQVVVTEARPARCQRVLNADDSPAARRGR